MPSLTRPLALAAFAVALMNAPLMAGGPAGGIGFTPPWGTRWSAPGAPDTGMYPLGPSPPVRRTTGEPLILQSPHRPLVPLPPLRYQYVPPVRYPAPY
jgi:hypothetical protein